jgi:hypothetical protein
LIIDMNNTSYLAFFQRCALSLGVLMLTWHLNAQVNITTLGTPLTEDFNTLASSGTSTVVPTGWAFFELLTNANTTYTAGTGSSNAGDTYSYGAASDSDRAFGGLQSTNLNYRVGASYTNNSGSTIGELAVSYTGEQWRLGALARVDRLDFQYSTNATGLNNGTWIDVNTLDFTAPVTTGTVGALNGNQSPNFTSVGATIGGLAIANGTTFWIRWTDFNGTGADDGLAVDNFSITPCDAPVTCPQNFSICLTAGTVPLTGHSPNGGAYSGPGVSNNMFTPAVAGLGTHTITYTAGNGICYANSCSFTITVITCTSIPNMQWVLLPEAGQSNGSCFSETNCEGNIVCFGLQYIPSVNGIATSYTTGFFMDCEDGDDPVLSHQSCVQTDASDNEANLCDFAGFNNYFHNFSGQTPGTITVTTGVPVIIHQVCMVIPNSALGITIVEDEVTDLTVSIDLENGDVHDDYPSYFPFSYDSIIVCGLLPVKYASFNVRKAGDFIASIEWTTAEEISNSHFEVQRSNDSGKSFQSIGVVDAAILPRTINNYSFLDMEAKPGVNYYRLKQVDRDGAFAYSPLRSLNFTTSAFAVKAFPNPAHDVLNIFINHADQPGTIHLVDMAGREHTVQSFEAGDSDHPLAIDNLIPGVYSLIVQSGQSIHIEKLVVVR